MALDAISSSTHEDHPSRSINPRANTLRPPRRPRQARCRNPLRLLSSICRTLPIFTTPRCRLSHPRDSLRSFGTRVSGTLFGRRRGRLSLSVHESPRSLPWVVLQMAVQTQVLLRDLASGTVRIALECESDSRAAVKTVMEEKMWTVFYNGRKSGYGVRRDADGEDLALMELLNAVSTGAGVLPGGEDEAGEGEVVYLRAYFEHVIGSRDSETLYLQSPENNIGPDLTIFFVRI